MFGGCQGHCSNYNDKCALSAGRCNVKFGICMFVIRTSCGGVMVVFGVVVVVVVVVAARLCMLLFVFSTCIIFMCVSCCQGCACCLC